MKHSIEILSGDEITVGHYLDFNKAKNNIEKAVIATGKPLDEIKKLPYPVVKEVAKEFNKLIHEVEPKGFAHIITLDGVEYGIEPNLDRLETGAFADITHFEDLGVDKHLDKFLAILYRPITHKWGVKNVRYRIESYCDTGGDLLDNSIIFRTLPFSYALGVRAFFLTLQSVLMRSIETEMTEKMAKAVKEMKEEIVTL